MWKADHSSLASVSRPYPGMTLCSLFPTRRTLESVCAFIGCRSTLHAAPLPVRRTFELLPRVRILLIMALPIDEGSERVRPFEQVMIYVKVHSLTIKVFRVFI